VHVQVAAQVGEREELRQRTGLCGLELAAILAQLRWNEGEVEGRVDARFVSAGDALVIVDAKQAVLIRARRCCVPSSP
jgi:hypothetical protein